MADDDSIIPRAPGEDTTVAYMVLDVAHYCSFWDGSEREDITDHKVSLLPAEHELASVHSLRSNEEFLLVLVAEGMAEGDACQWRAAAGVMDDVCDHPFQVSIALAEVE